MAIALRMMRFSRTTERFSTTPFRRGNTNSLSTITVRESLTPAKRIRIINDPNRLGVPANILRLIGKVITVSLDTVDIVAGLPNLGSEEACAEILRLPKRK